MNIRKLAAWCDDYLQADRFEDYCPNGLQVEAESEVRLLVSGVTASMELIQAAIERDADAVLVHHGYFWKGEAQPLTGMKGRRIRALLENGISLLAYHLPLDAHPQVGNNAGLGRALGLQGQPLAGNSLVWGAELPRVEQAADLAVRIGGLLDRPAQMLGQDRPVRRLAWCTGAAQGYITQAAEQGYDAFLSGEVSEQTYHQALELGISYFAAGHHATERFGVRSLGGEIADRFDLRHEYVDLKNPV